MLNRHIWIRGRLLVYSVLILYVLVSVAALTCVGSMESAQHRHHAAPPLDHSSHSLLCDFACQANIGASLSVGLMGLFVAGCWLAAYGSAPRSLASHPRQWRFVRGPPLSVLSF
jgi:hypothetical protein